MKELTYEILQELIDYNPSTGIFTWRKRDAKWFKDESYQKRWNARFSGKVAGNVYIKEGGKKYIQIVLFGKHFKAHRLAWFYMTGKWPIEVDHEDGYGLHNWWSNLWNVTHRENSRNKRKPSNNTSGVMGVYWDKGRNQWHAQICVNHKCKFLGYFEVFYDAVIARNAATIKYGFHPNHGQERPL